MSRPFLTARWTNLVLANYRVPRRACVFLREFVPVPLVVLGARLFYHQPYFLAHLSHDVQVEGESISVQTHLQHRGRGGEIRLRARNDPKTPPSDSQERFLKEHYWGFDRTRSGKSFRYRVYHPVWRTYPIEQAEVTMSPGALRGGVWEALDWDTRLHSVLFAEGSAAAVYEKESLFAEDLYGLGNAPAPAASTGRRTSTELPEPSERMSV